MDATDSDNAMDPAEAAVLDIPDDTAVESVGIDDVPTLDADDDATGWSPITPASEVDEEWN